jgi:predicted metal-dependent phosphotriesterase family hydrolase
MMDAAVSTETSLDISQITLCHMQNTVPVLVKGLMMTEGVTLAFPVCICDF